MANHPILASALPAKPDRVPPRHAKRKARSFAMVALDSRLQQIRLLSGQGEQFASKGEKAIRNSGLGFTIA